MSQTTGPNVNTTRPGIVLAQTAQDLGDAADNSPAVQADINQIFGKSAHTQLGGAIGSMLAWAIAAGYLPPMPGVVTTIICGAGAAVGAAIASWAKQQWLNWKARHST